MDNTMKKEIIEAMKDLRITQNISSVTQIENGIKQAQQEFDPFAFKSVVTNLKNRLNPRKPYRPLDIVKAYKNKVVGDHTGCGLCDSSGWLTCVVLDCPMNRNRWIVNYSDPSKALNYCVRKENAKASVIILPCTCTTGRKRNLKYNEQWLSESNLQRAHRYSVKFGGDRFREQYYAQHLADTLNARKPVLEKIADIPIDEYNIDKGAVMS